MWERIPPMNVQILLALLPSSLPREGIGDCLALPAASQLYSLYPSVGFCVVTSLLAFLPDPVTSISMGLPAASSFGVKNTYTYCNNPAERSTPDPPGRTYPQMNPDLTFFFECYFMTAPAFM